MPFCAYSIFIFLVSYFCNLLAFSSTFLVATKISVSTSRVSLFYWLNLRSLFHLLCAAERARGERASRRSIRRDFFYFYVKKRYFDVSSQVYVKFSFGRTCLLESSSGMLLLFYVRH